MVIKVGVRGYVVSGYQVGVRGYVVSGYQDGGKGVCSQWLSRWG